MYTGCICSNTCFRSVGIFIESAVPWELRLVRTAVISVDNFTETPAFVHFFQVLAGHVLDPADGGHVDLFLPLGSCGQCIETIFIYLLLRHMTAVVYLA